jgi:peroxiredoxin
MTALLLVTLLAQNPLVDDGEAVLARMSERLKTLRSVSGVVEQREGENSRRTEFAILRPYYLRVIGEVLEMHQGDKGSFTYLKSDQSVRQNDPPGGGKVMIPGMLIGFEPMLMDGKLPYAAQGKARKMVLRGRPVWAVRFEEHGADLERILYVDEETHLPAGWTMKAGPWSTDAAYIDLELNPKLEKTDFEWTPPTGASVFEEPDPRRDMIQIGQTAPAFDLPGLDGRTVSLAELLKDRRALLVTFWFTDSAESRLEYRRWLRHYEKWKGQGLEVAAISSGSEADEVRRFVEAEKLPFRVLLEGEDAPVSVRYGVQLYPTTYLLDGSGKVVASFAGPDEAGLRTALRALGIQSAD